MIRTHRDSGADVTIAGLPVTREAARGFGVMRLDDTGRVVGFLEKPQTDEEINLVRMDPAWLDAHGVQSQGRDCLASMGIYLFNRNTLVDVLTKTTYTDFGKEVFPAAIRARHVQVHLFDGYWEDIGTVRAFYDANLSLAKPNPPFGLLVPEAPVYTRARYLPPTLVDGATISGSLIADGCQIGRGAVIENSIIGLRTIIGENATIKNSVLMGADEYETNRELAADARSQRPPIGIGAGTTIEGAIVDKNCRIGQHVRIANDADVTDGEDNNHCVIRDGIPVVVKEATLPDGWKP